MAYQCGEEVFRCEPFSYIIKSNLLSKICDNCVSSNKNLNKCAGCKIVFYCGPICQKKAWNSHHKSECQVLKNTSFNEITVGDFHDNYRNLLRIIFRLKNANTEFMLMPNGEKRYLKDLMSHKEEIAVDSRSVTDCLVVNSCCKKYRAGIMLI